MIKLAHKRAASSTSSLPGSDAIRVFVGKERRRFTIPRMLLASASLYFQARSGASSLWLEDQCPNMFELFIHWLVGRTNFQPFIDEAEANSRCEDLHDDLINVHLFAAQVDITHLQDLAMDAIQDIYLRCNWDIRPRLVSYVYRECDAAHSCRIRKWIVAMTAWMLGGLLERSATGGKMEILFDTCPTFWGDYVAHLSKTSQNKIKLHFKNPQLRLPSNNLRTEERHFGFRQCSFHTHRSSVGQGRCPHVLAQSPRSDAQTGESSFGSILGHDIVSPRTAIFDLYLEAH